MRLTRIIFVLMILPFVEDTFYIYDTEDSFAVEFYDCINRQDLSYCRRPVEPIILQRDNKTIQCQNGGRVHLFSSLQSNNISHQTILHQWKSSIEKVEQYSRYIKHKNELDGFICECTDPQSFGKTCEYQLPVGRTLKETIDWEFDMKSDNEWQVQMHGDIVCYTTLQCDYGLLCLDWREICDGVQQCMFGLDEENCDKLEFNECEDNEYRCMNGMCIPQEYFLDGQFDCLDWSDEIQYYNDEDCTLEEVTSKCDDRVCLPKYWSCGDGQCIRDRLEFQTLSSDVSQCISRRDSYYICETSGNDILWTLPSGRCVGAHEYEELYDIERTIEETCYYILKCALSEAAEKRCPCEYSSFCTGLLNSRCYRKSIQYPKGRIIAPYISFFYETPYSIHGFSPDFIIINGTIKCRGFSISFNRRYSFHLFSSLRQFEYTLCKETQENSVFENNGYDRYCHYESQTFNNRSYSFIDICNESRECISTYRIRDGIENCVDQIDDKFVSTTCSKTQQYRFQCSIEETTCLSITALGNVKNNCKNKYDELWMGSTKKLSYIRCNSWSKEECDDLRQYIETSWVSPDKNKSTSQIRISFRSYCDTFWNLPSKKDEESIECQKWWVCLDEQWQCRTGQCIDDSWVLDGEWDCSDASDEEGVFYPLIEDRNFNVVELDVLEEKFNSLYKMQSFSMICNLSTEYPCLLANISDPLNNLTYKRPCIYLHQIGDSHIDCYGGIDERNTFERCDQPTMLGPYFQCSSSNYCFPYNFLCNNRCPNNSDDDQWCSLRIQHKCANIHFKCWDGTCIYRHNQCNRVLDCSFGEDEYMCDYKLFLEKSMIAYREEKQFNAGKTKQNLVLYRYPNNTNTSERTNDFVLTNQKKSTVMISPNLSLSTISYSCNRGVGIYLYNGSTVCFCPPQYYGDKCQFHTDRIIVLLHLNLTQSIYKEKNDRTVVLKLLVLFLFEKVTLNVHEFHVQIADEMITHEKKRIHFVYSRSLEYLLHKKQRYHNRSNIISDHPYSVRIEVYESRNNEKGLLIAVWHYPIYFDYLPVFHLAKILRLNKLNIEIKPCLNNPCNQNEHCQQILNQKSKFICLCKSNFEGENCSILNQLCNNGYCSSTSLCKPDYRTLQRGKEFPYCLCPLNRFGKRCEIEHDQCSSNPCRNGASCLPGPTPDRVICVCTDRYYGDKCEIIKPGIELYINDTVNHSGSVVQYFKIDFVSFDLILVHQKAYETLSVLFDYQHYENTIPEIILVKLYFSHIDVQAQIYLVLLHLNVISVYGRTHLTEKNRCVDVLTLIPEYSPIKYHTLCQNNTELICFYDNSYICICNEDHFRVECFGYDHNLDSCSHCLTGGRCLKGNKFETNDFICLCPSCYSGSYCQFNSNSFAFTLDQLFFIDLTSANQRSTFCFLIIVSFLLFLIALQNNIFSFVTFRRQKCLINGVGQYLFCMSIINQINVAFLVARLIHLSVTISGLYSHPMIDNIFCKLFTYSLTCSTRIAYWLASLVAIQRVYATVYLKGQWLNKPQVARYLMTLTFLFIFLSGSYELVFVKSFSGVNNGKSSICVTEFPIIRQSMWMIIHQIVSIVNSILPLFINICCTITIICVITKNKMNIRTGNKHAQTIENTSIENPKVIQSSKQQENIHRENSQKIMKRKEKNTRLHLLRDVLSDNKEVIARPAISLIPSIFFLFSFPLFIVSFSLGCRNLEMSPLRYLIIVFYFISFIPQILTYFLYIYPSSLYSNEWRETMIGKWINKNNKEQRSMKKKQFFQR